MPDPKDPAANEDDEAFDEDEALDEALEETFPASDPISPSLPGGDDD
jgi:hypothetical protein